MLTATRCKHDFSLGKHSDGLSVRLGKRISGPFCFLSSLGKASCAREPRCQHDLRVAQERPLVAWLRHQSRLRTKGWPSGTSWWNSSYSKRTGGTAPLVKTPLPSPG